MLHGDGIGEGGSPRFETAWGRYLMAEQRAEGWPSRTWRPMGRKAGDGGTGAWRKDAVARCSWSGTRETRPLGIPRPATA